MTRYSTGSTPLVTDDALASAAQRLCSCRPHFHDPVVSGYAVSLGAGDGEGLGYNDSGGIPKMPLISMLLNG